MCCHALCLALAEIVSKKKMSTSWLYYVHYVDCKLKMCTLSGCTLTIMHASTHTHSKASNSYVIGMGNYSIIAIIVIILLAIIDIVYFSLTGDNRNQQLSCDNHDDYR